MRLPSSELDLVSRLAEFDVWITPSNGEIRDTERFALEMQRVTSVFDILSDATENFADVKHCDSAAIADTFVSVINGKSNDEAEEILQSLASVMFLVTGKSDNNAKCQLPIFLRDQGGWETFPSVRQAKGKTSLTRKAIPRELKAKKLVRAVVELSSYSEEQQRLLREFVSFVLSDARYASQLWSIGRSYCMLKEFGKSQDLLTPLVVFQVRGSVSASGGHDPEEILRDRMSEWGMGRGTAYNVTDVVVAEEGKGRKKKTRAYDFVLPYAIPDCTQRLFIQCQFYAGDSGSVSHKNVDQTSKSRQLVTQKYDSPVFVEYLDGAGYFSSLNGDLKSLLSMEDTKSFFQVRSAGIRLRRELQDVGFLTPLEIEHAILRADHSSINEVTNILINEGYTQSEVDRSMKASISDGIILFSNGTLAIQDSRQNIVRRYFMLDTAACFGAKPKNGEKLTGSLMVPGFGPFHGMKLDDVAEKAMELSPVLRSEWTADAVLKDIRWLCEEGMAISC